jgi:spore germination cell wall hydrolase CwlJ-like protein
MKQLLRGITITLVFTLSYAHTATLEAKSYGSNLTEQQTLSEKQLECLATVTYHESKGESKQGMIAVINVTLNRVKDTRFPKTVCGVVYAKGQYSWVKHKPKIKEPEQYALAKQLAQEVVDGKHKDYSKGALYFNSINKKPTPTAKCTTKIGGHTFWK